MDVRDEGEKAPIAEETSTEASALASSPFSRCPSAPPPDAPASPASVRVPHASSPAIVPDDRPCDELASEHGATLDAPSDAAASPPSPSPVDRASQAEVSPNVPVAPPRRSLRHLALAAAGAAMLGVAALAVRMFVATPAARVAATDVDAATVLPSVAPPAAMAPAVMPALDASAGTPEGENGQPSPSAALPVTATNDGSASRKPFRRTAARAALDALAPQLTDCRIPKGRSGRVELVFEPDGHISSSKPLDAYVGTFGGKCVAAHLKKARVPPFQGTPMTFPYAFVIPD